MGNEKRTAQTVYQNENKTNILLTGAAGQQYAGQYFTVGCEKL